MYMQWFIFIKDETKNKNLKIKYKNANKPTLYRQTKL
jgi:hypothetical protein